MSKRRNLDFLVNFKVQGAEAINENKESLKSMGDSIKGVMEKIRNFGSGFSDSVNDLRSFKESVDTLEDSLSELDEKVQELDRSTESLGDTNDKASGSFAKSAMKILSITAAVAAATVAIKKMISSIQNSIDVLGGLYEVSTKTGVSFENLQAASTVLDGMGVSINEYANGVRRLNRLANVSELYGVQSYANIFRDLGIEYGKFAKMKPEEQFEEFARAYNQIDEGQGRALLDRLGIRNLELPLKNVEALKENFESLSKSGLIMSSKDGAGLSSIGDSVSKIKDEWTLVSGIIAAKISPKISEIIEGFSVTNAEGQGIAETAELIGEKIGGWIDKVREVTGYISAMATRFRYFLNTASGDADGIHTTYLKLQEAADQGIDLIGDQKRRVSSYKSDIENLKLYLEESKRLRLKNIDDLIKEEGGYTAKVIQEEAKILGKMNKEVFSSLFKGVMTDEDYDRISQMDENGVKKILDNRERLYKESVEKLNRMEQSEIYFGKIEGIVDVKLGSDGKDLSEVVEENTRRVIEVYRDFKDELLVLDAELEAELNKNAFYGLSNTEEGLRLEIKAHEEYLEKLTKLYEDQKIGGFIEGVTESEFHKLHSEAEKQLKMAKYELQELQLIAYEGSKSMIDTIMTYASSSIAAPDGILYTMQDVVDQIEETIQEGLKRGVNASEIAALQHQKNNLIRQKSLDDINRKIEENIALEKITTDVEEKNHLLDQREGLYRTLQVVQKQGRNGQVEYLRTERQILDIEEQRLKLNQKIINDELEMIKLREGAAKFDANDAIQNELISLELQTQELQKRLVEAKKIADVNGEAYENSKQVLEIERQIHFANTKTLDIKKKINDEEQARIEKAKAEEERLRKEAEEEAARKAKEQNEERISAEKKILDLRIQMLQVTNQDAAANKLRYKTEREELIKTISDPRLQSEALSLFDKIHNAENISIRLSETQAQIQRVKNELENTSVFNKERMIQLSQQLLELEREEAAMMDELNIKSEEQFEKQFMTYEDMKTQLNGIYTEMTSNIGAIISGTKTMEEGMLDFLQSTLDMIAKVIQELLVAKMIESSMSMFGGGGGAMGSAIGSLTYHTGGIAGNRSGTLSGFKGLKNNEVSAVLEKGEAILTERQQQNVANALTRGGNDGQKVDNTVNVMIDNDSLGRSIFQSRESRDGMLRTIQSNPNEFKSALGIK